MTKKDAQGAMPSCFSKVKKAAYICFVLCIAAILFIFINQSTNNIIEIRMLPTLIPEDLTKRTTETKKQQVGTICSFFRGGLGNHMFMYSSIYGIAKRKGMEFLLNENYEINKIFSLNVTTFNPKNHLCSKAPVVGEKRPCAFDNITIAFDNSKMVTLRAYLQSWKYFQNYENDIRKQFVFKNDIQDKAQQLINAFHDIYTKAKNISKAVMIGVHIRRGDYLRGDKIKYGYQVATKEYLTRAMDFMRSKFQNCLFLVFTGTDNESLKWRNENVKGNDVINLPANDRLVDMCAMTKCNHSIITVGTFGWWSAWLANGTTIYYQDVARQNTSLRKDFSEDMTDFFPPSWIGMK